MASTTTNTHRRVMTMRADLSKAGSASLLIRAQIRLRRSSRPTSRPLRSRSVGTQGQFPQKRFSAAIPGIRAISPRLSTNRP